MNTISNTAFYCCGVRMEDARRSFSLCNDSYAQRFMDEEALKVFAPFRSETMPNISNISRCRIIDDFIINEINKNPDTTVITIGAGFDARPYRLSGGNWVEIDEPQVVNYKNNKLPVNECKNPLDRRSIIFSEESLAEKLNDIPASHSVVIVIEGVFMYLEDDNKASTLGILQKRFPQHALLCDLMSRKFFNRYAQNIHSKLNAIGGLFTALSDRPDRIFLDHGYLCTDRYPNVKMALKHNLYWKQARVPDFLLRLLILTTMKDMNEYAIYRFSYGY